MGGGAVAVAGAGVFSREYTDLVIKGECARYNDTGVYDDLLRL